MTAPTHSLAVSDAGADPASSTANRERLAAMFEAHYDLVWRVLRGVGVPDASAEDGAQQVFVIASRRIDDIEPGRERAFLCATAVKLAAPLRARPNHLPVDEASEPAAPDTPADVVHRKQQRALLERFLSQLDDELRTAVVLSELEGLSKKEVAEALGIPEGTAASRLRRGREELQAIFKRWKAAQR